MNNMSDKFYTTWAWQHHAPTQSPFVTGWCRQTPLVDNLFLHSGDWRCATCGCEIGDCVESKGV